MNKRVKIGLKKKFVAVLLSVGIVLMLFSIFNYVLGVNNAIETAEHQAQNTNEMLEYSISEWVKSIEEDITLFTRRASSSDAYWKYVNKELYSVINEKGKYIAFFIGYPDDKFKISSGVKMPDGYRPTQRPWYQGAMNKGEDIFISAPYEDASTGEILITISKKIINKNGIFVGVAGLDLNFEALQNDLSKTVIGKTGYPFLLHKNKLVLSHPSQDLLMTDVTKLVPDFEEIFSSGQKNGIIHYKFNKIKKFVVYRYIPDTDWIICAGTSVKELMEPYNKIRNINMAVTFIFILYLVVVIILAIKIIVKPLVEFSEKFQKAASGDLSQSIEIKSKDELGVMGDSFNMFMQKLSETLSSIRTLMIEIDDENKQIFHYLKTVSEEDTVELNSKILTVLDNVRNQTASSQQSLASLEEISATSTGISENVLDALKSINMTLGISSETSNHIDSMNESMNQIDGSVSETNEKINELKNISNDIGNIVNSINSIAEQTNLLALNAAIEAARAGEAGRGFSVVADEIRKLAEQTNKETKKIETLITSVQTEVENVQKGGEEINKKVSSGVEILNEAAKNIMKMAENISANNNDIETIASSANEQALASTEITTAIGSITNSSTEIEVLSTDTSEIAESVSKKLKMGMESIYSLKNKNEKLQKEMEFFKI